MAKREAGGTGEEARATLQGFRVIDMTWVGPGPFCSAVLGDLGADVVKIHEPDPDRRGGVVKYSLLGSPGSPGLRNCRTMGLDLKAGDGRAVFEKLVKTADVLIEGFRPGVVKRLGIDYDNVHRVNPATVYASLTGYGQDGPYRDLVGHDINYVAVGGLLGLTGPAEGAPVIPGVPVADFASGGLSAAVAVLAALMARERTGRGQYVDVSLTDAVVQTMSVWINPYLVWGFESKRGETWLGGLWPWYNVYETKDGKHISVGALEPWFYANLCRALGREDLIDHQYAEGEQRDEIFRCFREAFLGKTRDEWVETLRDTDACVAPVYSIEEVAADPQLSARGIISEMPHPTLGRVKQVGSMFRLSDSPFEVRNWSTQFGQHTREVLSELGFDQGHIESLLQNGVIG